MEIPRLPGTRDLCQKTSNFAGAPFGGKGEARTETVIFASVYVRKKSVVVNRQRNPQVAFG